MITIEIDDNGLRGRLDSFDMNVFNPPMTKSVLLLESGMKVYPSPPSGSRYRRTGTLGRRWTHEVTGGGNSLTGKVGNNTAYGPWVQSDGFQASIHQGRWQTDKQVLDASVPTITLLFENAAADFLG